MFLFLAGYYPENFNTNEPRQNVYLLSQSCFFFWVLCLITFTFTQWPALHPPTLLAHPHTLTLPHSSSYTVQFFAYSDISLPTLTQPYTPFHTLEHYYPTLHAVSLPHSSSYTLILLCML